MASTSFDVVINGTKAKIKRGVEGAYRKRYVRREIQQQLLSQSENPALSSRDDLGRMMQTSWAGGSTWWKPILGPSNIDSYFQSNHMDVWSEPGKVVPGNKVADAANTILHENCLMDTDNKGNVYAIGDTALTNASFRDVYKWTPASDAFVRETGYHSGVPAAERPVSMTFDAADGYFYVNNAQGNEIVRFNPSTSAQDAAWIAVNTPNITRFALHRQGILRYGGENVGLLNKSTPAVAEIFDDGMGVGFLDNLGTTGANPLFRTLSPIVSTPEGVYYVKNVAQRGQPVAWIFRLDRDEAGNWIGSPIGVLPFGLLALGITYHLGSVVVSATPDWSTAIKNDATEAEMILFSVDSRSGISVLGSMLGGRDELDETPYAFLASTGSVLYVGGHKRLWVYDAARGGLHPAWEWGTELSNGGYVSMATVEDSDGDSAMIFLGADRIARVKAPNADDPDTVTSFGDDETHYVLESNYFDFNLPFESKELSKIEIQHDAIDASGNQEWTVQIAADDGSFSDVLVNSTANSTYASADLSGTSGRRFRYKLIYQTKDTERIALRGLLVSASGGENVLEYELVLDGDELLNVDNEVQDEQAFFDALSTIAGTETQITFVDNMQEQGQETDTTTTSQMKVRAVEINKDKPGESTIQVVLRGA